AGAINAAAYGAGMSPEQLTRLWKRYDRKWLYRIRMPFFLKSLLGGRFFSPLADTRPLRRLLEENIDIAALQHSTTRILVTALNMRTSQINFFSHRVITIEHLMAAGAIPMLFPWQYIDKEPFWDAGIMLNTPITPALAWSAREIIVVLHSPVGAFDAPIPQTQQQTAELAFEQILIGAYTAMLPNNAWQADPDADVFQTPLPGSPQLQLAMDGTRLFTVAPKHMMGFGSLLNFSPRQADRLIEDGFSCARMQLQSLFS
ncbi:MAG: patatin-like phospholipase family protein, partial [Thermodesulfobacteriota bacterium]